MRKIPLNRPYLTGEEMGFIREALRSGHLTSGGPFSKKCEQWLEKRTGALRAIVTHTGTSALEIAAILAGIGPGDEVIMPSYTYVSTANAFVVRGGVPVFVDIRPDTLNIDEAKIERAITSRTKAIVPVHYAGVACEMGAILRIARKHKLIVIEDAAHGILASYRGRPLGSIGHMGFFSFHGTKNLISGEGGALLINDRALCGRAEIVTHEGTDQAAFLRGSVPEYSWKDIGSSSRLSELGAAFLWAQFQAAKKITDSRSRIWKVYHAALKDLESGRKLRRPVLPAHCGTNAHIYYLLLSDRRSRDLFLKAMRAKGIESAFHFVPLHLSEAGKRFGRISGGMKVTESVSDRLVRLPIWTGLSGGDIRAICREVTAVVRVL